MKENATLGDVVELQRGHDLPEAQRRPGVVPVIGSAGITGYHDTARVKGPGVTMGRSGASFGKVTYVRQDYWPHNASLFVKDFRGNNVRFVAYLLESIDFTALNSGSAQQSLNRNFLYGLRVWHPPQPVQERVATILGAYDDLIENCEQRIRVLSDMARSLYREWFVNWRFPEREQTPLAESPIGRSPVGWPVKEIANLIESHIGGGWGADAKDEEHTEPGWVIRGTDIPDARRGQTVDVPLRFHTPSNVRSRSLREHDIVFETSGGSKGQPVGRALLMTQDLIDVLPGTIICASFCKKVRPLAAEYDPLLLYLSLLEGYDSGEISTYQVQSTGISNFKWTEYISAVKRAVPPASLQKRFRATVEPWIALAAKLGVASSSLRRARNLLLPRLLSGQLEVGETP